MAGMKRSEFYSLTRELSGAVAEGQRRADAIATWFQEKTRIVQELVNDADENDVLDETAARVLAERDSILMATRRLAEFNGETSETLSMPEPRDQGCLGPTGRQPCDECGSRGKHRKTCSKSSNSAGRQEEVAEVKAEEQGRVALAGNIRAWIERHGPKSMRALATDFITATDREVKDAVRLLSLETWGDPANPTVGTFRQLCDRTKTLIVGSDRIGETSVALNISVQKATELWAAILKEQGDGAA